MYIMWKDVHARVCVCVFSGCAQLNRYMDRVEVEWPVIQYNWIESETAKNWWNIY